MFKVSPVVLAGTMLLSGAVCQAEASAVCPAGTDEAFLDGQIYNTIIDFNDYGAITSGVAKLTLVRGDERDDLLCSLTGTPFSDPNDHVYDHDIVCSDGSQLSFDTIWDPDYDPDLDGSPLNRGLERVLCSSGDDVPPSYFREISFPDIDDARVPPNGVFDDVMEGELAVRGCVVIEYINDTDYLLHPNMVVEGHLCLSPTE